MGTAFSNLNTESVSHKRHQTDEAWSCQLSTQMDPSLHLSTCVDNKVGPSNMDNGVVLATTSPTPKSEWKNTLRKELT